MTGPEIETNPQNNQKAAPAAVKEETQVSPAGAATASLPATELDELRKTAGTAMSLVSRLVSGQDISTLIAQRQQHDRLHHHQQQTFLQTRKDAGELSADEREELLRAGLDPRAAVDIKVSNQEKVEKKLEEELKQGSLSSKLGQATAGLFSGVSDSLSSFWAGLRDKIKRAGQWIADAWQKIVDYFSESDDSKGNDSPRSFKLSSPPAFEAQVSSPLKTAVSAIGDLTTQTAAASAAITEEQPKKKLVADILMAALEVAEYAAKNAEKEHAEAVQRQQDKLRRDVEQLLAQHPELRYTQTIEQLQTQFLVDVIGPDVSMAAVLELAKREKLVEELPLYDPERSKRATVA